MGGPIIEHLGATRVAMENEPASCARILLVGEDNPQSSAPEHALYPHPERCAGERLCNTILRLDEDVYLACYRTNLCHDGSWNIKKARERAVTLTGPEVPWDTVGMLGAKVLKVFQSEFKDTPALDLGTMKPFQIRGPLPPIATFTLRLLYLPHPSGRNLMYNSQAVRDNARDALRCLHRDLWSPAE